MIPSLDPQRRPSPGQWRRMNGPSPILDTR
jgi:hypothetical protein